MKVNVKKLLISLTVIMFGSFLISGLIFLSIGGLSSVVINTGQVSASKVFQAGEIRQININTVNTDINIIPVAAGNEIKVEFYGNTATNIAGKIPELLALQEGSALSININYPNAAMLDFLNAAKLTLDIYLPQEYSGSLFAETISGNFIIGKFNLGNLEFKSMSGSLKASSLAASVIKIDSTSGKVVLTDTQGSIDISNISGNVELELRSLIGDLIVKTISGKVAIDLPGKSEFDFALSSISGRIENKFGAQLTFADGRTMEGTVGKGASKLTVNTTSGEIKLRKGE